MVDKCLAVNVQPLSVSPRCKRAQN